LQHDLETANAHLLSKHSKYSLSHASIFHLKSTYSI